MDDDEPVDDETNIKRINRLTHNFEAGGQNSVFLFSPTNNAFCRVVPRDDTSKDDNLQNRFGVIQCGSNRLPLTQEQQIGRLEQMLTTNPNKFGDKYGFQITTRFGDTRNMTKNGDTLMNITHGLSHRNPQRCSLKMHHTDHKIIATHEVTCNMPANCTLSEKAGAFHLKPSKDKFDEYSFHVTGWFKNTRPCFVEDNGEFACNRSKECKNPFGCEPKKKDATFKIFEANVVRDEGGESRVKLVPWAHHNN